jgi:hypothetical protein
MNCKRCIIPEIGFSTFGNGTITGNGSASSSTGNLPVVVLTHKPTNFMVARSSLMSELVLANINVAWHHWKLPEFAANF